MSQSNHILLFGRKTFDKLYAFWPSPMALESMSELAEGMKNAEKIVFSPSLKVADWEKTMIIGDDMIKKVKELKNTDGNDMTPLSCGSILSQLSDAGLLDQDDIMLNPTVIGKGKPIFQNIDNNLNLILTKQRIFPCGTILLQHVPKE